MTEPCWDHGLEPCPFCECDERAWRRDYPVDDMAPAKGAVLGVLLSLPLWVVILAAAFLIWSFTWHVQ
jgi:hypothetical protein